jgi:hypothetical protein
MVDAADFSEKPAILEQILRDWESSALADDTYFTGWPEFLQAELRKRGYYIMIMSTWGRDGTA